MKGGRWTTLFGRWGAEWDADGDAGAAAGAVGVRAGGEREFGLPAEAKEAAAFALLAWQTWNLAGNVPAATGAQRPVVLGQITYA